MVFMSAVALVFSIASTAAPAAEKRADTLADALERMVKQTRQCQVACVHAAPNKALCQCEVTIRMLDMII
jgi:hypothetical protein